MRPAQPLIRVIFLAFLVIMYVLLGVLCYDYVEGRRCWKESEIIGAGQLTPLPLTVVPEVAFRLSPFALRLS